MPKEEKTENRNNGKDPHAVSLGRRGGAVGGKARAAKMTKEERSEAAKKAAEARWSIPRATHDGELEIGDLVLPCAVLEDGTRVLSQNGVVRAIGRKPPGGAHYQKVKDADSTGIAVLPPFLALEALKPFISQELSESLSNPIYYTPTNGGRSAYGMEAALLPQVCEVWLKARDAGALRQSHLHFAEKADILMRGLAQVGIVALVDEATGYQDVRDRLALQKILEQYITDEWAKWTKTFPDEYYKELFRLHGMKYPTVGSLRPGYIGHWTNDIVYDRLAPGVLQELRKVNPKTESGRRKRSHHQHLTREVGHPKLKEHLSNIIFLMKSCTSWDKFKIQLDRACPKVGDTLQLDLGD